MSHSLKQCACLPNKEEAINANKRQSSASSPAQRVSVYTTNAIDIGISEIWGQQRIVAMDLLLCLILSQGISHTKAEKKRTSLV